uniref:Uncharacterized protein n=1 Tax=Anopheles coluzzii TaxID=1518534 RepID=A0A8W7P3K1_ANOCL
MPPLCSRLCTLDQPDQPECKHSCVWARRVGDGACGTKGGRCQPCLANDTLIKLKLFDTRNNFHRFFKIG